MPRGEKPRRSRAESLQNPFVLFPTTNSLRRKRPLDQAGSGEIRITTKIMPNGPALRSSLIRAVSAKSPLVTLRLRKCTGYEDSSVLTASASGTYQENNILPTLQTGFDAVEVICAVHRLLVDLENDIPAVEANIIAK